MHENEAADILTEWKALGAAMRDLKLEVDLSETYLEPDSPTGRDIARVANSFDRAAVTSEVQRLAEQAPHFTEEDRTWMRETHEQVTMVVEAFRAARKSERS